MIGDWYNHAVFGSIFLLGFFIACSEAIWTEIVRIRWVALGLASAVFASFIVLRANLSPGEQLSILVQIYAGTAYGVYQWCSIVAALGFGRRWLTRDSATRRYLTDAIFPYYIVHQTVIVGVAFALRDADLSAAAEATTIIAATIVSCVMSYEIVKRVSWLRPLFGLKQEKLAV